MFFFTCLFNFWPIKVQTKAFDGIERMSCKCFAPLWLHFSWLAGIGMLTSVPESKGLQETTLTFSSYAKLKKDLPVTYWSANAYGIMMLIGICTNLKP
jgi:hypothetical protein